MNTNTSITRKTTDGLLWNGAERIASRLLQFVFSILVARILVPEHYGLIAIANICVSLSDVLVDSGMTKALLRKRDKGDADYAAVLWFNISVSLALYGVLWLAAPAAGRYYGSTDLAPVIRAYTVTLILGAACGVQKNHLMAAMAFRRIALREVTATLAGGITAYVLALHGAGVWALVAQGVTTSAVRTFLYWAAPSWRPRLRCSLDTVRAFFAYGSRLLLSEYIARIYGAVVSLFVGKRYSAATLGLYGKGDAFAAASSGVVAGALNLVTYPALAEIQDDRDRLARHFVSMTGLAAFVIIPLLCGLAALAPDLVPLLLTEKWCGSVPYLVVLCPAYMFVTLATIPQNYLFLLGKTSSYLKIQAVVKGAALAALYPLSLAGPVAVAAGIPLGAALALALLYRALWRELPFPRRALAKDILTTLALAAAMTGAVYLCRMAIGSRLWCVVAGTAAGAATYLSLAAATHNDNLHQIIGLIRPYLTKNEQNA